MSRFATGIGQVRTERTCVDAVAAGATRSKDAGESGLTRSDWSGTGPTGWRSSERNGTNELRRGGALPGVAMAWALAVPAAQMKANTVMITS